MLTWVLYYVRLLQATNPGYLINAQYRINAQVDLGHMRVHFVYFVFHKSKKYGEKDVGDKHSAKTGKLFWQDFLSKAPITYCSDSSKFVIQSDFSIKFDKNKL